MKTLYLDCHMGAAGDMLTAALTELFPDPDKIVEALNDLGVPEVRFVRERTEKCGIIGTRMRVYVGQAEEDEHSLAEEDDHHHHTSMEEIELGIAALRTSDRVKAHIRSVYNRIAQAESLVHGVSVQEIHFHEVGTLDALADIAAVCYLMEQLGDIAVYASHVRVGSGHVKCAHGILPVPAPATAEILKDVPIYGGMIHGELCTPTGAALLKEFVTDFGYMPVMVPEAVGYGMGKKDFPLANCVRAILGTTSEGCEESILELSCNLDDMTAEDIGFAMEQLLSAGMPEVFTTPIGMKKNRAGTMLTVLCHKEQRDEAIHLLFRHTTTLGIREATRRRYTLTRRLVGKDSLYGGVRCKVSEGYGVRRCKPEYDDLASIAQEHDLSLEEVRASLFSEEIELC